MVALFLSIYIFIALEICVKSWIIESVYFGWILSLKIKHTRYQAKEKKVLISREKIWYNQPEAQSWYRYEQKILRIVNHWGVGIILKLNWKFKTTYEVVKVEYSIQRERILSTWDLGKEAFWAELKQIGDENDNVCAYFHEEKDIRRTSRKIDFSLIELSNSRTQRFNFRFYSMNFMDLALIFKSIIYF